MSISQIKVHGDMLNIRSPARCIVYGDELTKHLMGDRQGNYRYCTICTRA